MVSIAIRQLNLMSSNTFAQEVINCAPDGILVTDHEHYIHSMNQAAEVMFGVKLKVVHGTSIAQLFDETCGRSLVAELRDFQTNGVLKVGVFGKGRVLTGRRFNTNEFLLHLHCRHVQRQGESCLVSFVRDISVQMRAQSKLQRQNAHLKATIDYSPVGISMIDSQLIIREINPAFANMLGYSVDEIIGRKFAEFTHPDDIDATEQAAFENFNSGQDHYTITKRYLHKDGHTVHAALSIGLIRDSLGNSVFAIANIENLTPHRVAQTQLNDQQSQLKHLERLSVLGEMSAGIAHEIDQPLTAISTYAQSAMRFMRADMAKPDRAILALQHLSQEAHRAGAVVARVRNLAKRRAGKNRLVDCSLLIDDVEALVRSDAQSNQIAIRLILSRRLPKVLGDPIELQQVVLNLIRNALDASRATSEPGSKEITIRTKVKDNGDVFIAVSDQGAGVDGSIAESLFRPFSTSKDAGMGLGLSISQSIVAAHGGTLSFRNVKSGGAIFYFTLPPAPEESTNNG